MKKSLNIVKNFFFHFGRRFIVFILYEYEINIIFIKNTSLTYPSVTENPKKSEKSNLKRSFVVIAGKNKWVRFLTSVLLFSVFNVKTLLILN